MPLFVNTKCIVAPRRSGVTFPEKSAGRRKSRRGGNTGERKHERTPGLSILSPLDRIGLDRIGLDCGAWSVWRPQARRMIDDGVGKETIEGGGPEGQRGGHEVKSVWWIFNRRDRDRDAVDRRRGWRVKNYTNSWLGWQVYQPVIPRFGSCAETGPLKKG